MGDYEGADFGAIIVQSQDDSSVVPEEAKGAHIDGSSDLAAAVHRKSEDHDLPQAHIEGGNVCLDGQALNLPQPAPHNT